ncbi:MAG: protoporphyrinogen oxidase [Acidimicrobiales bacterium]
MSTVVVVGGGITGLVAAREAAKAGADVTLVEPDVLGGKVRASAFDGGVLDEAADAFLARVPEGVALCRELGIDGDLVSPSARRAYVWSRGDLRLLPEAQVLGVPTDLDELEASGILSADGLARVRQAPALVAPHGDVAIGDVMRSNLGDEATERLVDPLVGGINAGDTDALSLAATVPQLDAAVRSGAPTLVAACQAQRAAVTDRSAPVFFAPRGGMGALAATLAADVDALGVQLVRGRATAIAAAGAEWHVAVELGSGQRSADAAIGSARALVAADGVVIAAPAAVTAELVRDRAPRAATLLAAIPYASVAMVSLAVPRDGIGHALDASGYLVPRVERRTLTACSWASSKWPHLAGDGTVWLRASVGRDGDESPLALDDQALVAAVLDDLRDTMQLRGQPREVRVTRWVESFPQYRPGHLDRCAAIDADLAASAPRIAVTGAAFRGLGVPACIRQGAAATSAVLRSIG